MTGLNEPVATGTMNRAEDAPCGKMHDRRSASLLAIEALHQGTAEIVTGEAEDVDQISWSFEIHRRHLADIGHDADGGDEERARDRPRAAVGQPVLVEEGVLARDEREAESHRSVVAPLRGPYEPAEAIGQIRVAPAEVVEDGRARRIGPSSDDVAQRLVHGEQRHRVGIDLAIPGVDTA